MFTDNINSCEYSVSSVNQSDICDEEKNVHLFAKQMLQSRLFIGNFQEKRYVESLRAYRDVISVASEETELIRDLEVVRKRIRGFYQNDHWIGITGSDMVGAPVGHCMWVELPDEIFGSYWYKISKVKFRPNEILLRLKVVRPVTTTVVEPPLSIASCSNAQRTDIDCGSNTNSDTLLFQSMHSSFAAAKDVMLDKIMLFFSSVATLQNIKESVKFTSVLVAAVVTGLIQLLQYSCDFIIKFMHETSFFIKAATPIVIACINLIGKIIGGFYLLILSMWRDRKGPPPVYQSPYINYNNPTLRNHAGGYGYNTVYFRRALPEPPRQRYGGGVKITPLD